MHIQVVQDLTCPWCRIGKHNLDTAAERYTQDTNDEVTIEWVPFLLDPVEPGSKESFRERLAERKGMSDEQIAEMFARVKEAGAGVGLDFHFDRVEVAVDTIPGHLLMALTPAELQAHVLDRIHTAYFEQGKDIGSPEVLEVIATDAGVPDEAMARVREAWATDEARAEVMNLVGQVQQAGISGVPFFVFDGALAASGAQPPETLIEAMTQARETPVEAVAR